MGPKALVIQGQKLHFIILSYIVCMVFFCVAVMAHVCVLLCFFRCDSYEIGLLTFVDI